MNKFIGLTRENNKSVYINTEFIIEFGDSKKIQDGSFIVFKGDQITVRESPDKIYEFIQNKGLNRG